MTRRNGWRPDLWGGLGVVRDRFFAADRRIRQTRRNRLKLLISLDNFFSTDAVRPFTLQFYDNYDIHVAVLCHVRYALTQPNRRRASMVNRISLACALFALSVSSQAFAQQAALTEVEPVGFDELQRGQTQAAIQEIKANEALRRDDPARSINLAVAYARQGLNDEARNHFEAALTSAQRVELETAAGKWVDSRELARRGLQKLARGEFQGSALASLR